MVIKMINSVPSHIASVAPKPFLKWAGGKTRLLAEIRKFLPKNFRKYHEPFVGGGALFFDLQPERAVLSDINPQLINCYLAIKKDPCAVMKILDQFSFGREAYYEIRATDEETLDPFEKAARMIYLNKTCFNGLWRVNRKGLFNVPIGSYKNPKLYNRDNLLAIHRRLANTEICYTDFSTITDRVHTGDLVYFDPPYVPISATSNFTAYAKSPFGLEEQTRLRDICIKLSEMGVFVLLSNSKSPIVQELYEGFNLEVVYASRSISGKGSARGKVAEFLVTNYEPRTQTRISNYFDPPQLSM